MHRSKGILSFESVRLYLMKKTQQNQDFVGLIHCIGPRRKVYKVYNRFAIKYTIPWSRELAGATAFAPFTLLVVGNSNALAMYETV